MSISKNNLRLPVSSVHSGSHSTNSKTNNRVCAVLLGALILFGAAQRDCLGQVPPYNVLVNPGAETGDLTGWTRSVTGYMFVVSTNGTIPNDTATSSNFLAHSGADTFQLFDTTGSELAPTASIYQDYPAIAGSQWSASCWAICYASNYFSTAIAYMSVAFYDTNNNVLGGDTNFVGTSGVFGSAVLDPLGSSGIGWIIAPPQAVDASGWLYLPATNFYYNYTPPVAPPPNPPPGTEVESGNQDPVSTNLVAPAGTVKVRYQLEFDNFADAGGDVYFDDCVLEKLNLTDPDITSQSGGVAIFAGLPASFTVAASKALRGETLQYQWQLNGTNLPAAGGVGDIEGPTTNPTLYLTNCQAVDAGLYDVVVSDSPSAGITNSITSVPVPLNVLTLSPLQKVNALGPNSGFENDPTWYPWQVFNGCYFATTNDFFDAADTFPFTPYDGNVSAEIGANGDRDNGCYMVVPAAPGTWWKAAGYAYISSSNDFTAGNTCRLQIWFKEADGNTAVPGTPTYESFKIYGLAYTNADMQYTNIDTSSADFGQVGYHAQLPRDQWCFLTVSNAVNNPAGSTSVGLFLDYDLPTNTLPNGIFMVPTNTTPAAANINLQVYEYSPLATDTNSLGQPPEYLGNATDAVYWDDMELIQILPVTDLTASVSGNTMTLSFSAGAGLDYSVLYKTNLSDATWSTLTTVTAPWSWQTNVQSIGTSTNVTVSDLITAQSRFYMLLVH